MTTITSIRLLDKLDDMHEAVRLQKSYWGGDLESVVPAHMLFSLATAGGHVLAAFDGNKMVAVLIDFLGTDTQDPHRPAMANLRLVSKRMIVLPEYRGQGVGFKLKKRQREFAIHQGIRLVTWTFDPLLAANAHLNIRKLGAICSTYLEDYYGHSDEGGLTRMGASDRLAVEWWVTSRRVEERLNGVRGALSLEQYLEAETPIVNEAHIDQAGLMQPKPDVEVPNGSLCLVEIPSAIELIENANSQLALEWRFHMREVFQRLFAAQYVVTDFVRSAYQGRERAFYLMSQADKAFERVDFSSN